MAEKDRRVGDTSDTSDWGNGAGTRLVRVVDREASPGRQGLTGDAGQGIAERPVPDSEPVPVQRGDGAFISSGFSPEWDQSVFCSFRK